MMPSKDELRKQLRKKRLELDFNTRIQCHEDMMQHLLQQDFFKTANHIACYVEQGSEMPTQALIKNILAQKKQCYLPCLAGEALIFSHYEIDMSLIENKFHILEPAIPKIISTQNIELFFLPLLGFDKDGHRLGQGKGYYDRSLTQASGLRVGLAFSCQQVDAIPADPWDLKLDAIITELGCHYF